MIPTRTKLRPRRRPAEIAIDGDRPRIAPGRRVGNSRGSRFGWARRLSQPLPLVGVGLLIVAAAGYLSVAAASRTHSREVLVAARSLPAGTRLTTRDLRLAKLSADPGLLEQLLPGASEHAVEGHRLAAPVLAGLPIGRASIAAANGGPAAFTLTVSTLHALGGGLSVGDHVIVLATFTSQTGVATARVLARNLVVLSVGAPPTGVDASSSTIAVTVALPNPSIAAQLALANNVGKIDLLREGSAATAAIPTATAPGNGGAP